MNGRFLKLSVGRKAWPPNSPRLMRILTNEYLCNVPNFKKPAKGGPANFARLFFNSLKESGDKHEWQGILIESSLKVKKTSLTKLKDQRGRIAYRLRIPYEDMSSITKGEQVIDPRETLSESIKKLSSLIKRLSPDVVFLNGFSLSNWVLLAAAHEAKKPIAIQHAGIWTVELDIYKDFFSKAGLKMMKKMELESSELATAEIFLNDFSRRRFTGLVLKGKQKNRKKSLIIPLPVDISFFKERNEDKSSRFDWNDKEFNIGTIARWDRIKNHEAITKIAELARKKKLPWKIHSVVVIPDTKAKASLKKRYRRSIDVIGHLTKEEVKDFCRSNDLVIIPSKFDVSPTILLEALACGTPTAISENVGFIDDYKKYDSKKWVIDFNDPQKAIDSIKKIAGKNPPPRLKRELFKKHEASNVFEQYLSLFKKLSEK